MTQRIVDRVFLVAGTVSLFSSLIFYLLLTILSVYSVERFASRDSVAGFSATSFILGAVVARLASERLMQLVGRRVAISSAAIFSVLCVVLYPFANEIWQFIALRLAHGAGFGVVSTLLASGVLMRVPATRRAEAAGYFGLPPTIATAVGPLLAVALLSGTGYDGIFIAGIVTTALAAVAAVMLKLPDGRVPAVTGSVKKRGSLTRSERLGLAQLMVVLTLVGFGYAGVIAYLAAYATGLGADWSVGTFFTLYAAVALVGRMLLGRVQDRFGDNIVLIPVLISFAVSLLLLATAQDGWLIAISSIFMGLGFGMFLPSMQAAAARVVRPAHMNAAVAAVFVSVDIGVGTAPFLLGIIISTAGYAAMYWVLSAVVAIAGILYLVGHGRTFGGRPSYR